ncbi:MAG: transglutaminase family protein [Pirellula sp.]|nr:transglutaminase family protein [Pirellula sp.]
MIQSTPVRYRILHVTEYDYSSPASLCHNMMRLSPRRLPYQQVEDSHVDIDPVPVVRRTRLDRFGNQCEFFSIESQHHSMVIRATSHVVRDRVHTNGAEEISFKDLRQRLRNPNSEDDRSAQEFCFDSKYVRTRREFSDYAMECFRPERSVHESLLEMTARIYNEFDYVPNSTLVSTTPLEVLRLKKGVCQDFAHLQIACLRSIGLAARYVSGYLLTRPAPGQPKLIGADASHAWVSVYLGDFGWLDYDPTNNLVPDCEHITLAWGCDYEDVAPVTGVVVGGGLTTLNVSVDVSPEESSPE